MKRFHIIDFTRWLEEEKCAVECRFYFEDEKTAMDFLRHRHVYENPESQIEKIWQILVTDDPYVKSHEARKEAEAKTLEWGQRLAPITSENLAAALERYQALLAKGATMSDAYAQELKSLAATSGESQTPQG